MPRASRIRFPVQPRLVPADKAARRLHLSVDDFRAKLPALLGEGFPQAEPVTGNFDLVAIDRWLDERAGLASGSAHQSGNAAVMRERIARMASHG